MDMDLDMVMVMALRLLGPLALAALVAHLILRQAERRGLQAPLLRPRERRSEERPADLEPSPWRYRRGLVLLLLSGVLFFGVLYPLGTIGLEQEVDLESLSTPQLFVTHALLLAGLAGWYWLGFAGLTRQPGAGWRDQLGLRAENLRHELGIGVLAGIAGWLGAVAIMMVLALVLLALGGGSLVPEEPPVLVAWIAGLPVWVRLLISLSAGVVEEVFFRGFLQPRVGVLLSTILFTTAHLTYEQPLMLVAIVFLSMLFAWLVRWRQSLYSAMTAHAVFDALQLLVVIPLVLRLAGQG